MKLQREKIMATKSFDERIVVTDEHTAKKIKKELDSNAVDKSRKTSEPPFSSSAAVNNSKKWIL